MTIQDWYPLGLTGLISLLSKGLSRVLSNIIVQKHQLFISQLSSQSNSHIHTWPQEKLVFDLFFVLLTCFCLVLTRQTFVGKVMSLLFNMLSRLVIAFLPRSKHLLISWLESPSAVILEPPKRKSITVSTVFPSICHEVMEPDAMILVFWMLSFKPTFSTLLFHFHQEALQFVFAFCHKGGVICISEVIDTSPGNLDSSLCFIQPSILHDVLCM